MPTRFHQLTDAQLEERLLDLVRQHNALTAEIVSHLAEIDARRLHLKAAYPSLFAYCVERLGLSEHAAYKRITAARLTTKYPSVLDLLAKGHVHLTALVMVATRLTEANHQELLAAVSRKSKRQIEKLLAERFPQPDQPTVVRKLPLRLPDSSPVLPVMATTHGQSTIAEPAQANTLSPADTDRALLSTTEARTRPADRPRIAPTAPARYRIEFTASERLRHKLAEAQALLSHQVPGGDVAAVIERALDLLIADTAKRRFGAGARERSKARAEAESPAHRQGIDRRASDNTGTSTGQGSRYIPKSIKRQVFNRDGGRCTYRAPNGKQCESRVLLQLDHATPYARGGAHTRDNIRLLCAPHNRLLAEQIFGREHVARQAQRSATRSGASRPGG